MLRYVLAMIVVATGVGAVIAQTDPLTQRKALMKADDQHLRVLQRMVRGEDPFDGAKVTAAFALWSENGPKLLPLFESPPPAGADTRALPKVWETKADFESRMQAFIKATADNKDHAKTLDELKVAFTNVNNTCNGCHEFYRRRSERGGGGQKQ
jgi:cytochrome c556